MTRIGLKVLATVIAVAVMVALPAEALRPASASVSGPLVGESLAQAASSVTWTAEFFNNPYLNGKSVYTTTYTGLNLYWGNSSPNSAVQSDNFSARFGADPYFTAGTYRFYVQANDAVKVKVGSVPWEAPQLDTLDKNSSDQKLSFDLTLTDGVHHIQIDYREVSDEAYLYFDWGNLAGGAQAPSFPVATRVNLANPWTVQYFNNAGLSGAPAAAQTETQGPNRDWGDAAPVGSIPADNFSVRFVSFQRLDAGTYEITAQADDGIRVFMNGQLLINEWHGAAGVPYKAQFAHGGGDLTFTVEYYDAVGKASVSFYVGIPGSAASTTSTGGTGAAATGTTATVLAWRLNVRDNPNATANILTRIDQGQSYPVISSNADQTWWQINVNGVYGWVSARWVRIAGAAQVPAATTAPTAIPTQAPVATGYYVTAVENVNIRAYPNSSAAIVGLLPYQQAAGIVGRKADNSWWQVRYGVVTGWVVGVYVTLQPGANLSAIPVTG